MHHNAAKNVLWIAKRPSEVAAALGLDEASVRLTLARAKGKLLAARAARPTPFVDTTLYVCWNAMFVSAYLNAAAVLGGEKGAACRAFALKTLDRMLAEAWSDARGFAHRIGGARLDGSLDDQIFAGIALLDVYELETDIKWPNDILANDRKLCGILAETVDTPLGRAVILGIGVNLKHNSLSAELDRVATSVEAAVGRNADLDLIIEPLLGSIVRYYQMLQHSGGSVEIVREWSARSSYASGKRIRLVIGNETIEGTTCGLESDGGLRIETATGEIKTFRAGDVTALRTMSSQVL